MQPSPSQSLPSSEGLAQPLSAQQYLPSYLQQENASISPSSSLEGVALDKFL